MQRQLEDNITAIPDVVGSETDHLLFLYVLPPLRRFPLEIFLLQHIPYQRCGFLTSARLNPCLSPSARPPVPFRSPLDILSSLPACARPLSAFIFPHYHYRSVHLGTRDSVALRKPGQVSRRRGLPWMIPTGHKKGKYKSDDKDGGLMDLL